MLQGTFDPTQSDQLLSLIEFVLKVCKCCVQRGGSELKGHTVSLVADIVLLLLFVKYVILYIFMHLPGC